MGSGSGLSVLVLANCAWAAFAVLTLLRQSRQIEQLSSMLASRSFSEYVKGQKSLTAPKTPPEKKADVYADYLRGFGEE